MKLFCLPTVWRLLQADAPRAAQHCQVTGLLPMLFLHSWSYLQSVGQPQQERDLFWLGPSGIFHKPSGQLYGMASMGSIFFFKLSLCE